ncbi:MAG: glycosyltransferase family 2 protein [Clostridia bacterium]|nr:glycosyltransferase family 2 protein [Clostridia bacterium]
MKFTPQDHTYTLCAYKESAFLEDCIKSLKAQTVKSNIIMATSTPNESINSLAQKYDIPLYINDGVKGIGGDWNFAYQKAKTPLVTIAHQDDIYEPEYTEEMLAFINKSEEPIIYFSGYAELREGEKVYNNTLLKVKKLMLSPLKIKGFWKSKFIRRRILSLGCPICCPAVTLNKEKVGENPFTNDYSSNIDWQQWEIQSRKKGSFVYNKNPLMCHRIHEESATSEIIGDNRRSKEDYDMFCKFWGKGIAKIIAKAYSKSEKSNNL